jgi:hypothetical protein
MRLGCDPEMFLADIRGHLKASCGLIGGTKEAPLPIPILGEGFAVQEDNVAIEFNIPPASTAREFVDSISRTIKVLNDGIHERHGLHVVNNLSAASFPPAELEAPAARVFGCDPDFNAWTGQKNPRPRAKDRNLRSCGGHIHIGDYDQMIPGERIIKMMDLCTGVPSVLMDDGVERRKLYGKRGAYRNKPYGVEYRTLSNFWIFKPALIEWAFRQTERAVALAQEPFDIDALDARILEAIDGNSKDEARKLVREYNLEVCYA